jgi:hypothetical protein
VAKTYKREVAIVIILYLFYIGIYGRPEIVEAMVWPFMMYVGAAFGMEWARSQLNEVNKSSIYFSSVRGLQSSGHSQEQASGEHQRSGRQGEQSGSWFEHPIRGTEIVESRE